MALEHLSVYNERATCVGSAEKCVFLYSNCVDLTNFFQCIPIYLFVYSLHDSHISIEWTAVWYLF